MSAVERPLTEQQKKVLLAMLAHGSAMTANDIGRAIDAPRANRHGNGAAARGWLVGPDGRRARRHPDDHQPA
jgi:hypothetical protein